MLEDEIKLQKREKKVNARESQVNARESQVNARESQVNAKEVQVNKESEMINRTTIVTVILQLNNSIQHGNPDRSGIVALGRIKNPILQEDITFLRSIDTKLTENKVIAKQDIATLKNILTMHCLVSLKIYNSFTPEIQKEFISTKEIAIGAQQYAKKYM